MVLIGFLTRVRSFTWREGPFQFHLFPGTLSSNLKTAMTPIMLVEVNRPKIEIGLHFFRTTLDDVHNISSNGIAYPFFSL